MSGEAQGNVAVVLLNLGGPDCETALKPFLFNFFTDKNIIRLPFPLRHMVAWLIATKRSSSGARQSYGHLGFKSPLLGNTLEQADALESLLNSEAGKKRYKCFVCMSYWHPMAPQVAEEVKQWKPDHIVLLPLYPQYSTTTTLSSFERWKKASRKAGIADVPSSPVCCYPENEGFIKASVKNIIKCYEQARSDGHKKIRILLSAHGLPEKIVKGGDPYQNQCECTAQRIMEALKINLEVLEYSNLPDWQICYQSKVGPFKWTGPSTEEAIEKAATDGYAVIVYPHAFTQEHVETLVELDEEYRDFAKSIGLKGYYRVRTVGTHPDFIAGLAEIVRKAGHDGQDCSCPSQYSRCCMRESA